MAERRKVSKSCWENCANRRVQCRVTRKLLSVRKHTVLPSTIKEAQQDEMDLSCPHRVLPGEGARGAVSVSAPHGVGACCVDSDFIKSEQKGQELNRAQTKM